MLDSWSLVSRGGTGKNQNGSEEGDGEIFFVNN